MYLQIEIYIDETKKNLTPCEKSGKVMLTGREMIKSFNGEINTCICMYERLLFITFLNNL